MRVPSLDPKPSENRSGEEGQRQDKLAKIEQNLSDTGRQLGWERWLRQIICRVHNSLDRDIVLQSLVDGFGRAFNATRCVYIKIDLNSPPQVTHEYAEPNSSPLGLGRTGAFPQAAVSYFKSRAAAVPNVSLLEESGRLSPVEMAYFADNGIAGMVGAPVSCHGATFGVVIVLEGQSGRKWSSTELDMVELAACQAAVALSHCQTHQQLKEQIFNTNVLSDITRQLTTSLDCVSRSPRPDDKEERRAHSPDSVPLSMRELEVLKLIAGGLANREIAQRLFLTESTVELHASRIRKKLKLKSRTALVKYACDNSLV